MNRIMIAQFHDTILVINRLLAVVGKKKEKKKHIEVIVIEILKIFLIKLQ